MATDPAREHFQQGNRFYQSGDYLAAIQAYEAALAIRSDFASALNNLGFARQTIGEHDAAIRCFLSALEVDPGHVDTLFNLACLLCQLGGAGSLSLTINAPLKLILVRIGIISTWAMPILRSGFLIRLWKRTGERWSSTHPILAFCIILPSAFGCRVSLSSLWPAQSLLLQSVRTVGIISLPRCLPIQHRG